MKLIQFESNLILLYITPRLVKQAMSEQIDDPQHPSLFSEVTVTNFLRSHPNFFNEHPDLLLQLSIPHQTGKGVVSLIERQALIMRRRIEDLEKKLEASKQEELIQRHLVENVRRTSLELLNSSSPKVLYQRLSRALSSNYHADRIRLYIFTQLSAPKNYSGLRFKKANAKIKYLFSGVFNHHRPLCGSLQDEHIKALFDVDAELIHATVLIPLKQEGWEGLLALGSCQWNCYSHGASMELLVMISDMASRVISEWLEPTSRS